MSNGKYLLRIYQFNGVDDTLLGNEFSCVYIGDTVHVRVVRTSELGAIVNLNLVSSASTSQIGRNLFP